MDDSWASSASPLTEDDFPLLPPSDFGDHDPSSYLLYPPGFGPVECWLDATLSPGEIPELAAGQAGMADDPDESGPRCEDLGLDGGRVELERSDARGEINLGMRYSERSGNLQLGGLSDGQGTSRCVGGFSIFSSVTTGRGGSGVDGCTLAGSSAEKGDGENGICASGDAHVGVSGDSVTGVTGEGGSSDVPTASGVSGREDSNRERGAPVLTTEINMEEDNEEETNSLSGGPFELESGDSSSSSSRTIHSLYTDPFGLTYQKRKQMNVQTETKKGSSCSSFSSGGERSSEEETNDRWGDDDDDDEDDRGGGRWEKMDEVDDLEEGEIRDLDTEVAVSSEYGGDEDERMKGPTTSKKAADQALLPVPSRKFTLARHHHTLPVGVISLITGNKVIVEGRERHNTLNEGSVLWITDTRSPLGLVDKVLGPAKNPSYVVRYNSKEFPSGISEGVAVSFVIVNDPGVFEKVYDASQDNDEVVGDEAELQDSENESEYNRSLWQAKRGTDTGRQRNEESLDNKRIHFDGRRDQFNTCSWQKDVEPSVPCVPPPFGRPSHFPSQLRLTRKQSCIPRQRHAPHRAPSLADQLQAAPQYPFVPCQLQAPIPRHWVTGQYQAPTLTGKINGGNLACFPSSGSPEVHTVPPTGQPRGPFEVAEQKLLMQQPNAGWARGLQTQKFIKRGMNRIPRQQLQQLHAFHQHHNQVFQQLTKGIPFPHQFSPTQVIPPCSPRKGGLPTHAVPPRCLGPMGQGSFRQAPPSACEQGVLCFPNVYQNRGQFQPIMDQNGMHAAMKFNFGHSLVSERKPYGRGGRYPSSRNR